MLAHVGAEPAARRPACRVRTVDSIAQWAAEYEHIAPVAQRPRWARLVTEAALATGRLHVADVAEALDPEAPGADAFYALCAELRRAEAYGYDVERVLPALASRRTLLDADNPCAVLHARLERATGRPVAEPALVGRVVPAAIEDLPEDTRWRSPRGQN